MIRFLSRAPLLLFLMFGVMLAGAAAQTDPKAGTGVISGRVTVDEKPIANLSVGVFAAERGSEARALSKTTTDYDGRYRLTNVPAGRFTVVAIAPAHVGPNEGNFGEPGKTVTIAEGEIVEGIDFALLRGGVITGRVIDADGMPVIGERVHVANADTKGQDRGRPFPSFNPYMFQTDDRGIYRIYGIPPGRYIVSVGEAREGGGVRFGFGGRGFYAQTFHPDVTVASKATIIDLREGTEASNVDIALKRKSKSFTATGRVVDESGKPIVGARVGHGGLMKDGDRLGGFGFGTLSDPNGTFLIDGLTPGRYGAFVWNEGDVDGYSDLVKFEISEGNVNGLELKLRRGSSISGVAIIEGTEDRGIISKLSQMSLGAYIENDGLVAPNFSRVKIAPDGSFRLGGLRPGKARLHLANHPPDSGIALARIEREGVPVREIEIAPGAHVTGVRVVFEYGNGSVRGIVKIENGPLPDGARMYVNTRRRGNSAGMGRGAPVDSRGRFLIEGISAGEHELVLQTYMMSGAAHQIRPIKQIVSIASGVELEVSFTLDVKSRQPETGPQ